MEAPMARAPVVKINCQARSAHRKYSLGWSKTPRRPRFESTLANRQKTTDTPQYHGASLLGCPELCTEGAGLEAKEGLVGFAPFIQMPRPSLFLAPHQTIQQLPIEVNLTLRAKK